MREPLLFLWAPRIAAASALLALVVHVSRIVRERSNAEWIVPAEHSPSNSRITALWRLSIGIVATGHLIALASPNLMLIWNRDVVRLVALELFGWVVGAIAAGSFIAMAARDRHTSGERPPSAFDAVSATMVLLALVSGFASAVVYRWGSYWSAVTLTPYLHSLLRPQALPVLVLSMPAIVKLHVVSACVTVALIPWTAASRALLEGGVSRAVAAAVRPAWRPAPELIGASTRPALSTADADRAQFRREKV